jgi:glyoxylase-like metal-dependent hydrolase (beta-lactamase superfamily II)
MNNAGYSNLTLGRELGLTFQDHCPASEKECLMAGYVLKQFLVSQMMVFAYLIGCESSGKAVVIDPAAEADHMLDEAERCGFRVTKIINTHGHVDHIMGNAEMQDKTDAPILMHEADVGLMTSQPQEMFQMFGGRPSPPADETLGDGDVINLGDLSLEVLHTPGHTPGSICLHIPGAILTGDTLFVGGIGRTDLPGGSLPALLSSIKDKLFVLPGKTVVYPGHGYAPNPTSTLDEEIRTNPYLNQMAFT